MGGPITCERLAGVGAAADDEVSSERMPLCFRLRWLRSELLEEYKRPHPGRGHGILRRCHVPASLPDGVGLLGAELWPPACCELSILSALDLDTRGPVVMVQL